MHGKDRGLHACMFLYILMHRGVFLYDPCAHVLHAVFDNVRSNVPHMLLDDVFTAKEEIATSVKEELVRQPVLVSSY
jgi:hypothetical protein